MPAFRHPLVWSADWIKRRLAAPSPLSTADCASPACAESKKNWPRFRGQPGTLLNGKFCCHRQCLEMVLTSQLSHLLAMTQPVPPPNRIPLGLLMVARGKLTHIEVRAALDAQHRAGGGKIGDWFEKLGFATEQDVTAALALQWGCPVASSFDLTSVDLPGSIPLSILAAFQMIPVNYAAATSTLYLAFGERVDHAALYAIERTLNCRTQPCVARRKSVARRLESMGRLNHPNDVEFVTRDLSEIVRITLSYINRLRPEKIRASRIGSFIWLRLQALPSSTHSSGPYASAANLVFCLQTNPLASSLPPFEFHSSPLPISALSSLSRSAQDDNADSIGG